MLHRLRWVGDGTVSVVNMPMGDVEVEGAAERDRLLSVRSPSGASLWVSAAGDEPEASVEDAPPAAPADADPDKEN